ncbi:nucleotide disphospho-sugar-binding domain-containing protein [Pedococcus bigeumensis]|uniref:Glycosyltransferase n=1 Tax=Pedococcus bigeumensis TaxID=433644 RepID=A0A502CYP3_9MICO|nr:nucleotide disphospho-sugar-binding domain-containing protein [Pedococcus bigeumensis]TPG17794.1 glycosyltransferase [Pedococcus bigeumensis]
MTLLLISPDYASHLLPLATLGTAWAEAGERVVVATGPATDAIVRRFGFEREDLRLGRGSNPGVIRAEDQPRGEDQALRGFFEATRLGAVPTLAFQAAARGDDLLWEPLRVAREVQELVDRVRPDQVIVDHLAFSARLGLTGAQVPHADVVLGHPSALTVGDEVYGYPPAWPNRLQPSPRALDALRRQCEGVRDAFTEQWNTVLATLDPGADASHDAFAETGDVLLLNYPEDLHAPERTALLPRHAFLGSTVRSETPDREVDAWLARDDAPIVYVSLGTFLSVRSDVLARVAEALRGLEVRVALAAGSTSPDEMGPIPPSWLVRGELPQVTVLGRAALAVSHGGNNSVTEAMAAGVPLLLLPLSTDQFTGAAAIEAAGLGTALDPNAATPAQLQTAVEHLLALAPDASARLSQLSLDLTRNPGPRRARVALAGQDDTAGGSRAGLLEAGGADHGRR